MIRVAVIGSGNVAEHLIKTFRATTAIELVKVYARHPEKLQNTLPEHCITDDYNLLPEADVYIIAITDDAINGVSAALPFEGRLVVHTSGSVDISELDSRNRRGVFYPLQTFSRNKEINFETIPLCVEAETAEDYRLLEQLAQLLSGAVYRVSSAQRRALHVAAVFVSNFSNHMYHLASDICNEHGLPFELLKPLILETAQKVQQLEPALAQTGPAVRHDQKTIEKHLSMLNNVNQKDIYTLLTTSIQQLHDKEL